MAQASKQVVPILMYHSISVSSNPRFRKFTLAPQAFAEQMSYLKQNRYEPITVTQFARTLRQGDAALPERPVILTFDDGFADFYDDALPLLTDHGFVATLYITTGFIGRTSGWLQREGETTRPMLTWTQIADISAAGIECGAHTHTHPQLDTVPLATARDEIVRGKSILERQLAREVSSFAYPFGYYDRAVRRLVQQAGFTSACAVRYCSSSTADDCFTLARHIITADTDVAALARLLASRCSPMAATYGSVRSLLWRIVRRGAVRWQHHVMKSGV